MNPVTPQRDVQKINREQAQQQTPHQSLVPEDAAAEDDDRPHHVQEISREVMEKLKPADPDPDDPAQP